MDLLSPPYQREAVGNFTGMEWADDALAGLEDLEALGVRGETAAAWIETIRKARADVPRPDLVWTGPKVAGLHARDTREVFDEMLGSARRSIWASTYAYFDGKRAFEILASRMDAVPELEVTLLLNIRRDERFPDSRHHAVQRAADFLWNRDWPGGRRPRVFYDPRALDPDPSERSVLHAKAIVQDETSVLITSANFTEAALDRNIELGVYLEDARFARQVVCHYQRLVEESRLLRLPD